jgi:hypothetical protein
MSVYDGPAASRQFVAHRPSVGNVLSDLTVNYLSTAPGMVVSVPGLQPLTIGCRDSVGGLERRFSWCGDVPVLGEPAA